MLDIIYLLIIVILFVVLNSLFGKRVGWKMRSRLIYICTAFFCILLLRAAFVPPTLFDQERDLP